MIHKRFLGGVLALATAVLLVMPMPVLAATYWNFGVKYDDGVKVVSPTCEIYAAGTRSTITTGASSQAYTVYTNPGISSSKTNPTTANANGVFTFYTAASVTSVDAVCYTTSGQWGEFNSLTPTDHTLILKRSPEVYHLRIAFSQNASETDTGVDLPHGAQIEDVMIETRTLVASGTIDVGLLSTETYGDADGFCDAITVQPAVADAQGYAQYNSCSAGSLAGDLLTGVAYGQADTGVTDKAKKHVVHHASARSISYTTSAHAITGFIHVYFKRL